MQLFRTILIILIIYYGFKLLSRYVFPLLFKRWVEKKMGQFQQFGGQQFQNSQDAKNFAKQKEGEVKIKSTPKSDSSNSSVTDSEGEYVDFEEIK